MRTGIYYHIETLEIVEVVKAEMDWFFGITAWSATYGYDNEPQKKQYQTKYFLKYFAYLGNV